MSRTSACLCVILLAALTQGCMRWKAPVQPARGAFFTNYKAPLSVKNADIANAPESGMSSTLYFHDPLFTGLDFAWDDCSIETAAANGGLSAVEYADYEILEVLGVFGKFTVRAHGQ